MIESIYLVILVGAGLIAASAVTSLISQKVGAPLLLIFLAIGLLAGEDGPLGIQFDDGSIAYFVGSLALAIILFDSGFATSFRSYRVAAAPALILSTIGVLLTTALVGLAARLLFDLLWVEAFLLGAIVASTDAAAVFFLLRVGGITIRERVRATLEIESGTNDPMAVFLTIALVELAARQAGLSDAGWDVALTFTRQIGLGLIGGALGGLGILWIMRSLRSLDVNLHPIVPLILSLIVFAGTGLVGGSGFLAAYVAGLVAGNLRLVGSNRIRRFQVGMTWLAQIGMFLTLGLLATPSEFGEVVLPAILLSLVLIVIARPIAVLICLAPFRFKLRESAFVGWVGLRGAVSILLAILPTIGGVSDGGLFFNTVFVMVLTSLLLQGWTIGPAARLLRLTIPPASGIVDRIELELPGRQEQDLIGYRVHPDSPVGRGERAPRWARPVLVVRGDRAYTIHNAGAILPHDRVYLFSTPRQLELLDRVYGAPAPAWDSDILGDFPLSPEVPLGELRRLYGADIGDRSDTATVADTLSAELHGRLEIGDRMQLGDVEIVVRNLEDSGRITQVGLSLLPSNRPGLRRLLGRRRQLRITRPDGD